MDLGRGGGEHEEEVSLPVAPSSGHIEQIYLRHIYSVVRAGQICLLCFVRVFFYKILL